VGALERGLIEEARRLGFARCGVAPATPADGFDQLLDWVQRGYAGEMSYLIGERTELRRDPRSVHPPVRSVIMVAMSYAPREAESEGVEQGRFTGRIARYAQGADYHRVVRERLKQLGVWLQGQRPGCWCRAVVDTAPLLERDFARRAGLGWFGKNTMLIDKRLGSWTVLGGLLVDVELEPSAPFEASHCGTCTACLDSCPTGAFSGPFLLDARKCISYLTIELKGDVPVEMRQGIGDWVFGCDVCNEVCPWNRKALPGEPVLGGELERVDLIELLGLSEEAFRERFAGTALHPRPGRRVVVRNAALALGNVGDEEALPALRRALGDEEGIIREAARWAIGRIESRSQAPPGPPGR
jgi:epoxyqueuosine reductase